MPGPVLISDEENNRLLIIDHSGRTLWQYPGPGDLAAGQTFKTPDDAYFTPTGAAYLYESNEIGPNRYLTVDHASPGQVLTFDRTGKVLWRYAPTGRAALNKPSLALPLPNGDYLVVDSANHRVIVVNARTKAVVWQYGQTKVAGARPGQLNKPTSLDFLPPDSLLIKNTATMGAVPR